MRRKLLERVEARIRPGGRDSGVFGPLAWETIKMQAADFSPTGG
jgi:hypothetical protein